jgi:hypothetical protein
VCEVAKVDHLLYKFRVYRVLFGLSNENINDFQASRGNSQLSGKKEIEDPLQTLQREVAAVLEANKRGNADATVAAVRRMETASSRLIEALERMAHSGESATYRH